MYELLKTDSKIRISVELVDNFEQINASLADACGLALRQRTAGKQYVLMTDASQLPRIWICPHEENDERFLIEENDERKVLSKKNFRTRSV